MEAVEAVLHVATETATLPLLFPVNLLLKTLVTVFTQTSRSFEYHVFFPYPFRIIGGTASKEVLTSPIPSLNPLH